MQIDRLSYGVGLDLSQLDRDASRADALLAGIGSSPIRAIATGGVDSDQIAAAFGSLGSRLGGEVANGTRASGATLSAFAAHINAIFDRTAGATIEMFRRIDAAMKFPTFDAALTRLRSRLVDVGTTWSGLWDRGTRRAAEAVATTGGMVPILRDIGSGTRSAEAATSKLYSPTRALADAWGSIRSRVAVAREEMALAASRPPPAGRRPGVGRAFSLPKADVDGATRGLVAAFDAAGRLQSAITRVGAVAGPAFGAMGKAAEIAGKTVLAATEGLYLALMAPVRVLALVGSGLAGVAQGMFRWHNLTSSLGDVSRKTYRSLFEETGLVRRGVGLITTGVLRLTSGLAHVATLGVFKRLGNDASLAGMAIGKATGSIRSFAGQLIVAAGLAGIGYKVAEGLKSSIKAASDLNETVSASRQVFGSSFGAVNDQVERNAKQFGLLRRSQLDAANGFGSLAQGAGYSERASATFANTFTQLAADLASFKNLSFEDATGKISSALAGQSEPLRRFGVLIDEDAVKTYALTHGLATSADSLDNHAKMAARAALIQQGLAAASGDLARTSDSAANQFRKAGGGIANFSERIGSLLLPAVQAGATAFNELLASALEVFEGNLPAIQSWADYLLGAMNTVGRVVRNLGAYWQVAALRVGEFAANAVAWINTIPDNFGPITAWLGRNWANLLRDMIDGTATALTNLGVNALNFGKAFWDALSGGEFNFTWTPLLDGFTTATEQLPELIKPELLSVQAAIDEIWAGVDKKEKARAEAIGKALPRPKDTLNPATDKAQKEVERKLAAAIEVGSKESYSIIQANKVGSRDGGIKSVAANTKTAAEIAKQHLEWVKNHPNGFNVEMGTI